MKQRIENSGSFSFHYPGAPIIVTAKHGLKENAMTAVWHCPLSFSPSLYGIALSSRRFTCQLILDSKEFGVNFMPLEKVELVAAVGGSRGAEIDKFEKFKLAKEKPLKTSVPVLKDACATYECRLHDHRTYGDHELLVGEVVAVHYEKDAFTERGLNLQAVNALLYLGGDNYGTPAKDVFQHWDRQAYGKKS
ncbi:MAG: flavin reductase family protein [Chloroflexi bacterium]|nr:flavin reductase family protein [Chloroflexota bacterium]